MYKELLISALMLVVAECYYKIEPQTPHEQVVLKSMALKYVQMNEANFYNYFIMCSGAQSRVNYDSMLVHSSIPAKYFDIILNTLHGSSNRKNKCPRWASANIHTRPESGSMSRLVLDERSTELGQVVYLLSAIDPEKQPLFYYVRKSELEPQETQLLLDVKPIKIGENWYGEVRLVRPLSDDPRNELTYLIGAFDGSNILEHLSVISVIRDVPSLVEDSSEENKTDHVQVELVRQQTNEEEDKDAQPASSLMFLIDSPDSSSINNQTSAASLRLGSFEIFLTVFKFFALSFILILVFLSVYLFFSF